VYSIVLRSRRLGAEAVGRAGAHAGPARKRDPSDSLEDLAAAGATEAGATAGRELLADERRFIDLARSPLWIAG
jgi:hypothetical protein